MARPALAPIAKPTFVEACRKCGGTGRYGSFGQCYACKGRGKNEFKTSAADRAKARQGNERRSASKLEANWTAFVEEYPGEAAWITANPNFSFAVAMGEAAANGAA